jgi:hypothetical protein
MDVALRVKSAEFWLKLGEPTQALRELNALPAWTRRHPWAIQVLLSAVRAARELGAFPA